MIEKQPDGSVRVSGEDLSAHLQKLTGPVFKANADFMAECIASGGLVCCLIDSHAFEANARKLATVLGWSGRGSAFRVPSPVITKWVSTLDEIGDRVTHTWLTREPAVDSEGNITTGRVFLITPVCGTLLVNFTLGLGFGIEPGSTDGEGGDSYTQDTIAPGLTLAGWHKFWRGVGSRRNRPS
jgi:hypothetical protein